MARRRGRPLDCSALQTDPCGGIPISIGYVCSRSRVPAHIVIASHVRVALNSINEPSCGQFCAKVGQGPPKYSQRVGVKPDCMSIRAKSDRAKAFFEYLM